MSLYRGLVLGAWRAVVSVVAGVLGIGCSTTTYFDHGRLNVLLTDPDQGTELRLDALDLSQWGHGNMLYTCDSDDVSIAYHHWEPTHEQLSLEACLGETAVSVMSGDVGCLPGDPAYAYFSAMLKDVRVVGAKERDFEDLLSRGFYVHVGGLNELGWGSTYDDEGLSMGITQPHGDISYTVVDRADVLIEIEDVAYECGGGLRGFMSGVAEWTFDDVW